MLQSQLHNDNLWRQQDILGECFHIHSVKSRTVPVVFMVEGSFDELCDPGYPRGILLGINLLILLAIIRHEYCFTVENVVILLQCVTLISGT